MIATSVDVRGSSASPRTSAMAKASPIAGSTPEGEARSFKYTIVDCSLGRLLVGATKRGVCALSLGDDDSELIGALKDAYPTTKARRDDAALASWVAPIVRHLAGAGPNLQVPIDVNATAFQRRVWEELRAIPYGTTRTYLDLAIALDLPTAFRAVGHACATNPVAVLIPCHRVIRTDGGLGGYRWGLERKKALLARESCDVRREL